MNVDATSPDLLAARLAPSRSMRAKFMREVAEAGLPHGPTISPLPMTEEDLAPLPAPAQRYARFMGVVGRPRDWSFRVRWTGGFRMRPDQPWTPCEAWQYNSRLRVARIFHMRVRVRGLVPMLVRDTYVAGHGHMVARALDAFSVVDEAGYKIDTGELVTYLNDAVFFAPSMLLGPETKWSAVDAATFDVTITDTDHAVTARVFVDDRGAVRDFSTTDRFGTDPAHPKAGMVRMRWSTPVPEWTTMDGRIVPARGVAIWHLPSGDDFAYAAFRVAEVAYNVDPVPAKAVA